MEACDGGGMEFQQENAAAAPNFEHANPISQEASTVAMNPMVMMPKPPNTHRDPFFSPNWDSFSSMTQSYQTFVSHQDFENFSFPPVPLWENQGMAPNMAQYLPTHSGFVETVPRAPCFMNRSLPDCLPQGPNHIPPGPNYASNVEGGGGASEGTQNKEGEAMSSPSSEMRRKRTPESSSTYDRIKSNEGMLKRDASGDNSNVQKDHYEKKQRTEQPEGTNSRGKQTKDDSNSGQPAKENYIHMRARRGQATNSHSLAERVRREKISERMRMLQELVPGCNKITGKAVMLDEIINYVQSLQQQVEFLSMKLSTLLPDMSFDLEQILSKEILQANNREPMVGGLGPMTGLTALPSTSQYASLPQAPLDNELQTLFQMGFDSTSAMDILKHSRRLKPEQ